LRNSRKPEDQLARQQPSTSTWSWPRPASADTQFAIRSSSADPTETRRATTGLPRSRCRSSTINALTAPSTSFGSDRPLRSNNSRHSIWSICSRRRARLSM